MRDNSVAVQATVPTPKVCPACNTHYAVDVAFCSRDGSPLIIDPSEMKTDLVGQVLVERYRILRLLGEGGMGQVYEAQHVNINKKFAIKLLRPEITSNAEAVARFRQEAWSASSIGHENIVEIDDFATLPSGAVYLAMEFLRGCSLAERMLAEPRMSLDETLDVMLQVCRGLDAAHEKGIVHRDMKPENVFLADKPGRVVAKILDFGIAKVSGAESSLTLTRTGAIFGTPHYMSPEQALGRSLDHRADIYSVGVMMYEAFTGRVPFEAESFMGILTKHITVEPTPPREMSPDREILPEIEALILRAMAKEVSDRQQTMHELVGELEAIALDHAPQVLQRQSGSISATMAIGAGSGAASVQRARAATPSDVEYVRAIPTPMAGAAVDDDDMLPATKSRAGLYAAVALTLFGAGAGLFVFARPTPDVRPAAVAESMVALPTVADVTVLVDSEPVGAEIVRDGARLGDTPQNLTLKDGRDETIVLRKAGYVTTPLLLRHDGEKRRIVRLERVNDPVTKTNKEAPSPVVATPLAHAPPAQPAKHGAHSAPKPQQGSDIIDPY